MLPIFKRKAKREILDGKIFFISLVDRGANEVQAILKGKTSKPVHQISSLAKMDKQGLLHTLVYGPDRVDMDGEIARRDAVQRLAHKFIPNMVGSGIDIMHSCNPLATEEAHVCESFIIQKNGDDRFRGVTVDGRVIEDTSELEGWWAAILKLDSPELRKRFEAGEWTGVSMFGTGLFAPVAKRDPQTTKRNDMDPKELFEALAKALAPFVERLDEVAKSVEDLKPEPEELVSKQAEPIEFTGDPNKLEDIEAHEEKIFKASLDFSKPEDLARWKAHLSKKAEADKDPEGESDALAKAKAEAEAANRRVAELAKASKQDPNDVRTSESKSERMARIRKNAKSAAHSLLKDQGRLKD